MPDAIYNEAYFLDNEKEISRIYVPLEQKVSIHNKNTWRDVMDFFNENMNLFEAFFEEYKDVIEGESSKSKLSRTTFSSNFNNRP